MLKIFKIFSAQLENTNACASSSECQVWRELSGRSLESASGVLIFLSFWFFSTQSGVITDEFPSPSPRFLWSDKVCPFKWVDPRQCNTLVCRWLQSYADIVGVVYFHAVLDPKALVIKEPAELSFGRHIQLGYHRLFSAPRLCFST